MNLLDVVGAFQAAQMEPSPANLAELRPMLADQVDFAGLGGRAASGVEATLGVLSDTQVARLLGQGQWETPSVLDDVASITVRLAPGMPIGGTTITFRFVGEQIASVSYEMLPGQPAPVTELILTATMKEAVGTALDVG